MTEYTLITATSGSASTAAGIFLPDLRLEMEPQTVQVLALDSDGEAKGDRPI